MAFSRAAILTKENAVSLAAIVILTDTFVAPPVFYRVPAENCRLDLLMLPATLAGAAAIFRMLSKAPTAGFSVDGHHSAAIRVTEARAIFVYFRLALLPIGQSVDHDFPVLRSPLEYGAIFWALALTVLLVAAVRYRRSWPLTCFGLASSFFCPLAPTSSIVPILDPLVERRMYLPMLGLILIGCEWALRIRLSPPVKWSLAAIADAGARPCLPREESRLERAIQPVHGRCSKIDPGNPLPCI